MANHAPRLFFIAARDDQGMGSPAAGFPSWQDETWGEAGSGVRNYEFHSPRPNDRATTKRRANPVLAAHAEFVATLAGHAPRTIPLEPDAIDLEDRAEHLSKVFSALSVYVAVILDDTAQNVPGRLDLPDIEAILFDLASDVTGTIQHAAEGMGWRDE
jgi:hypothetical protein